MRDLLTWAPCLLVCSLLVVSRSDAQQPSSRGFGGPWGTNSRSYFHPDVPELPRLLAALATHSKVKEQLQLTPQQITSLTVFLDAPRAGQPQRPLENFNSLPAEERERISRQHKSERESLEREQRKQVEAVEAILTPEQKARLKQIVVQLRGIEVLADREVIEDLEITEGQVRQFTRIGEDYSAQYRPLQFQARPSEGVGREGMAKIQKLKDEMRDKMLALLTPEQKAKYEAMQGEKIDIDAARLATQAMLRRPRTAPRD